MVKDFTDFKNKELIKIHGSRIDKLEVKKVSYKLITKFTNIPFKLT